MKKILITSLILLVFTRSVRMTKEDSINGANVSASNYMYWPSGVIPFYIEADHFDEEQKNDIMSAISLFAFKTCLKFVPSLSPPEKNSHLIVFANPEGVRQCVIDTKGHPREGLHVVILGYECLRSPYIDMMVMKALGFPFEHNRASRDLFIDVQFQNIEPSAVELFTKGLKLPPELRSLAYDIDSVMHFGERDFSKNGHRTIIFKGQSPNSGKQQRIGLSALDLRKINLVYGPECRMRDRQMKISQCQNNPSVSRRKRDVQVQNESLRVNRDITPPPSVIDENVNEDLKEQGVKNEVNGLIESVYKVSEKALRNARWKYCNESKVDLKNSDDQQGPDGSFKSDDPELVNILTAVKNYAKNTLESALANLTEFCLNTKKVIRGGDCVGSYCPSYFISTNIGSLHYSTKHRPTYIPSTTHSGMYFVPFMNFRSGVGNNTASTSAHRRKRFADNDENDSEDIDSNYEKPVTKAGPMEPEKTDENSDYTYKRASPVDKDDKKKSSTENDSSMDIKYDDETRVTNDKVDKGSSDVNEGSSDESSENTEAHKKAMFRQRTVTVIPDMGEDDRRRKPKKRIRMKMSDEDQEKTTLGYFHEESLKENQKSEKEDEPKRKKKRSRKGQRENTKPSKKNKIKYPKSEEAGSDVKLEDKSEEKNVGVPMTVELSVANKEFYSERMWPGGVVKYVLKEDTLYDLEDLRSRLDQVNRILATETCARIQEVTEADARKLTDYLVLDTSSDYVTGRVGGRQPFGSLELYEGGQHRQHAAMMVMAMLGFYFELARHDRDQYVRVHLRHVRPDKLHHFEKITSDATFPLPYDYESASHPAWQFWRKIGVKGISTVATFKSKDPEGKIMKNMGQNSKLLSKLDLVKINSVYGTECFANKVARFGRLRKKSGKRQS